MHGRLVILRLKNKSDDSFIFDQANDNKIK
jgi:hypothetical protein